MRAHLATSVPGQTTARACWADLGLRCAELVNARRVVPRFRLSERCQTILEESLASGRGVLVATCHLGNWELMAAALAARGIDVHAVAARDHGGPLHAWLTRARAELGVRTHHPGGGAIAAIRVLRRGGALAIFIDQATREQGRPVQFFGRMAHTPDTCERLAALTGAQVLLAWTLRSPGAMHDIFFEAIDSGPALLERLTARVEALVRAHPTQWVWLHRRWACPAHRSEPGAKQRGRLEVGPSSLPQRPPSPASP